MPASRDDALAILRRLRDAGHIAYFAGGCVRDLLLGLEPKDYDVATDAPPQRVRQIFSNTQAVGAAFGVILVRHRGSSVEVATFRTDLNYVDGRRPEGVVFTTAEVDARRRDFTINGLFLDPIDNRVIDYVGGQEDLKNKILRAIGEPDHRFEEDHLRMLRAVRFAARFDLQIDPTTAQAIRHHAPQLKRISPERIADELRDILTPPSRIRSWELLKDLALLPEIVRKLTSTPALKYPLMANIAAGEEISFGFALAVACLDCLLTTDDLRPLLTSPAVRRMVSAMRQTLKISNEESDELAFTLTNLAPLLADSEPTIVDKKRFLAKLAASNSLELMQTLLKLNLHTQRIGQLLPELLALRQTDYAPAPFITGDDLIVAGLAPGPAFKRALDAVYDAQLEGRITNRDDALAFAIQLINPTHG